jgi:hypothetical protein
MADGWLARKFAGVNTAPLFDETEIQRRKASENRRPRPAKVIDRVPCPGCGQEVSLHVVAMRDNRRVLGIKQHWRMTNSGASLRCARSETEIEEQAR